MPGVNPFWFRTLFKLKIYQISGNEFQKLFEQTMQYHNPEFQVVKPHGNLGDGGNDGWIPTENRYFQVNGPQATSSTEATKTAKKATDDFEKLKNKWGLIEFYHFVFNDRYEGIPTPIGQQLKKLQTQNDQLKESTPWGAAKLEHIFMQLADDQKEMIVGGIPSDTPSFIDSRAVGELLSYLADKDTPSMNFLTDTFPDFDKKIELNGLSSQVRDFIKYFNYQTQTVDDFLAARSLAQAVSMELASFYQESQQAIPDAAENAPDLRYGWLVEKLIHPQARSHPHSLKAYREAAQVILAKYFEVCDVYEHPDNLNPT